ncbi:MAG: helix-turn-helix domain-containing protein [Coriobacteriales bacterium]|jgi:hypothetical protein|nr:helix-turn-helix domain-containing protein [Coriobacteriales bacterium]
MKLNMQLIEHEMRDQLNNKLISSNLNSDYRIAALDYPLLLESLIDYKENVVYVASQEQLSEIITAAPSKLLASLITRPFHCICVGTPPAQLLGNQWCDCIWVGSDIKRSHLLNVVQELFQRFEAWEWRLEKIVSDYGNITDLVVASLDIVKNDIWVHDQFSKILVRRIYKNLRLTEEQIDEVREGEMMPKRMIDDGNEEELNGRDFGDAEPIFYRMQAHNVNTLSCAIHISSNYTIHLAFHPNFQDVGEKDYILIRTLAHYIELAYSRSDLSEVDQGTDPRYFLITILEGKGVQNSSLTQYMASISWINREHTFLCLCCDYSFERRVYDSCFIRSHLSTCGRIQQKYDCLAVPYHNLIVVLVNLTTSKLEEAQFLQDFREIAENYNLAVGVSMVFNRLQETPGRYLQANLALKRHSPSEQLVRFEDHLLEVAVDSITEQLVPEFFVPKELLALIHYDKAHNTELYHTLNVYLDCNCSATQACKALFIVRSSFIYRLGKLEKLLGLDLRDPAVRLLLSLSFKIIEQYGLENLRT